MQAMNYGIYLAAFLVFVRNRLRVRAGEEDQELEAYPLVWFLFSTFLRFILIAVKYATFPRIQWLRCFSTMTNEEINATLIASAWVYLPPDKALIEIEKTMISYGLTEKYFQLKVLTPIYKPKLERLTKPDYWESKKWDIKTAVKTETKINEEFEEQMNNLKLKHAFGGAFGVVNLEPSETDDPLQVKSFL